MKKITCLLAALLLMCGLSWAQQITWSAADQGYENGQVIESVDFNDYVAGEFFKGTNNNAPKYYTTGAAIRCYGGNYFTITSDYVLTEIVFGFATGEGSNAITSNVGTYEDGTWTGSANEVTFTISGTSGHRRFATFTITYDEGGNPAPVINANNVEIAYDATEGAIEYTINNGVDGGVLSAATEAEWLTIGTVGETVPFTCSVNDNGERVATVTLTYTYDTDQTVTKNVTVTQATNPNGPGSEANPYTVAQARAAIDAGTGTQGVYATGIVSAIPTAYNPTYENVTFNMVDEEGDEVFLQAYRCGGDEAANVAIGDVVVVFGNLTKYNTTYEFGQGCQVVSLTHPVNTDPSITVDPAVVNVDAEEHDGTLEITYANIPDLISFDYYFCDANGNELEDTDPNYPDWIDAEIQEQNENYSVYYVIDANDGAARTAYFKVYTFVGVELEEVYSIVTINQDAYVAPVASITIDPDFLIFDAELHYDGALPFTYENIIVENNQSFGLQFYTAEGEETGMPGWFYAMVTPQTGGNDQYQVSCATMANEGEARSVYFKVYALDADSILVYSNLATVTQAAPVYDYAVLPFVWEGGSSADFLALNGVTAYGLGGDYASGNAPYLIKFDGTGDYIQVKTDSQPGKVTIGVKMVGGSNTSTITIQGSADGETFTDIETLTISGDQNDILTLETTNVFDANDRYVRMLFTKGSNVGVGPITITKGTAASITLTPDTFELEAVGPLNGMHLPSMMVSYHNFEITQASDFNYQFYNAEGEEQEMPEWILHSEVSPITDTSYQAICIVTANNGPARSAYFKVYAYDADSIPVYSNLVTFNQAAAELPSITVTPATLNVDAEEHDGTLDLTYENLTISDMTDFDIQYYNAEGQEAEEPTWIEVVVAEQDPEIGEGYVVSYYMLENEGEARSAYFKVYAMDDETNLVYSNLVTINQAAYVAPVLDYAELPFAFNGGKADIEGTDGLTQEGLGNDYNATSNPTTQLKFDGTGDWMLLHFNEAPGTLTFDIKGNSFNGGTFTVQTSEDGETYEDLVAYTELGDVDTKTFDNLDENVRYIKWIYTEKSQGNVGLGDIHLYEVGGGPAPVPSITFTPDVFNFDAEQHVLQIPFTYENIEVTNYQSFTTHFYDAEGEEIQLVQGEAWYYCSVTGIINGEGYQLTGVVTANEGEARSAYIKVSALDAAGETVYSNLVTVNQAAPEIPFEGATYTLVNYIESGRHYIITNGIDNAMGGQNNNNRAAVEITVEDGVAQVDSEDVFEFVINGPDIDGFYTIYDANEASTGYLYAASNSSNWLRTREFNTDANSLWSIEFDEETNVATLIAQGNNSHNWMRYNNSGLFSCYGETSNQQDIYLFVKDDDTYEFYMDIKGYTEGENDAWYAISTPVNTNPTNVNHMLDDTFDLYMFNPTDANGEVWQNYKVNNFVLTPGEGYLYANENNVTLRFAGAVEDLYDGDGTVALPYYNEENEDLCWNLVGNPFGYAAYTLSWDFYVMKEDGSDFELSERDMLNPFEAIFVKAEFEGDETFFYNDDINPGGTGGGGVHPSSNKLNVRVSDENGKGDFARVRFGEGNNLEKFMLNPTNTKIYFPMEGDDYAVVYADNMGEMPLNFSAAADGDYTLDINLENIEMEYLHLIDNMTGTDVDLLATPSYSFYARVNDNAARFTLVFANLTGMDENNADQFAFFSNGNLIVSNEGNAMLQVVDVTGRIVKSESINGTASVSVNATPGVYMLRLVNGDNLKVQKVVVK
jgi:hypothetical protein